MHVGGWLRNIFAFYLLDIKPQILFKESQFDCIGLTTCNDFIRKVILKGKNMNNYFPQNCLLNEFQKFLIKIEHEKKTHFQNIANCSQNCSTDVSEKRHSSKITNNWNKFCYEFMVEMYTSVNVFEYSSNEMFDVLLSENIVFINLIDASAVNTLIECIIRNTPIIINRHPAVIELLGENYPLLYGSENDSAINYITMNIEVNKLLSNSNNIKNAHKYLKKIDKNTFKIEYFISKFIDIVKKI